LGSYDHGIGHAFGLSSDTLIFLLDQWFEGIVPVFGDLSVALPRRMDFREEKGLLQEKGIIIHEDEPFIFSDLPNDRIDLIPDPSM
jgi:hypothetical protein